MSHYTVVRTKLTNKDCIIKTLKSLGFHDYMIEVSDQLMTLKGYKGDERKEKANIRIRGKGWGEKQNYVGGASNDLGLELQEDGSYTFHISEYDRSKYNDKWLSKFKKLYGKEVVKEICEQKSLSIEEEEEIDGEIYLTISSQF